jgi:hypothetical protein
MSLLQVLNLPPPKRLAAAAAAPLRTAPAARDVDKAPATPAAGSAAAPDLRAAAQKLRDAIEGRRQRAREVLSQLRMLGPRLEQAAASAAGEEKRQLASKQALLEKKRAEAVHIIEQAEADLKAIESPASRQEELVSLLARHRSGAAVSNEVEIAATGLDPSKKSVNRDVTETTTSFSDGKATVEKVRDQQKFGTDGWTKAQSHDKVVQSASLSARTSDEKKTNVSLTGKTTIEEKTVAEVELPDGRKAGVEKSTATEVSTKGASQTQTVTQKNFDGSSTAATGKHEIERGEGKLTAKASRSVTQTSASGTAVTRDTSAGGGMIAGKDGIGAHAGVDAGKKVTTKSGTQAGAVAGLHANVVCKIGDPHGDPKLYPVTLTVSFGASVGVSGGIGKKEGSNASAGVEVKGGIDRTMVVTHMLGEAELADYTQALQAASKGGKGAATGKEFAIIAAGVGQGWDAARQLWESGGKELSKKTVDSLKRSGDSVELSEAKTSGMGGNVGVKGVGLGIGSSETDERSTKVTRTDKDALDVEAKSSHAASNSLSASASVGVAGMEVGTAHTHKTSFGYSITIDPKNDPDGKMLEALSRCRSQIEYEVFIATHYGKLTVTGRSHGKADAASTKTGVSIAGVKASIGTHEGVDEQTATDGTGKIVKKTVAGHAGAGGEVLGFADSVDEDAVAETDADGTASLTMTRTTTDNHDSRARSKKARKVAEKLGLRPSEPGKQVGVLTSAAGGEENDSATHDVSGLTLSNKDLQRIGGVACRSLPAWMGMTRRYQETDDWQKAGLAIAKAAGEPGVVAEELARFIGGDRVERMKTVELFLRGGHDHSIGKRFEFPDGLRDLQAAYEMVTADAIPGQLDKIAESNPAKAIEECKRLAAIADTIDPKMRSSNEFANKATKMEMLQRLTTRREQFAEGLKGYAGNNKPQDDPKVLDEKRARLTKQCVSFFQEQARLHAELSDLLAGEKYFVMHERSEAMEFIRQMEDLQHRWQSDFLRLKETMAKLGAPNFDIPTLKPDESILAFYEKAARL